MLEDFDLKDLDRLGFQRFLIELADSLEESPEKWENNTLIEYIHALSAWVGDMDGYFKTQGEAVPAQPSWRIVAHMLLAAKIYE